MLTRTLVSARSQLIKIKTGLSNQIRGLMKTFGLIVPKGAGRVFDTNVRSQIAGNNGLERIILPLLEIWRSVRARAAELDRQLVAAARERAPCQLLMPIPGVGWVVAASFAAAIEAPENFRTSTIRSVAATPNAIRSYGIGDPALLIQAANKHRAMIEAARIGD